jgi:hypothetical protein
LTREGKLYADGIAADMFFAEEEKQRGKDAGVKSP